MNIRSRYFSVAASSPWNSLPYFEGRLDISKNVEFGVLKILVHWTFIVELQLERWRETVESHGLRVSRGKTEYMPCPEKDQTIYIQEQEVKTVKTFKYLGQCSMPTEEQRKT